MDAIDFIAELWNPRSTEPSRVTPESFRYISEQDAGPLIHWKLSQRAFMDDVPAAMRAELAQLHRDAAILEPFRRAETARVIEALAAAGVPVLVFKGTALAYTCYPEPHLRPRLDTDLLIRTQDASRALDVFEQLHFTAAVRTSGEHVTHQMTYLSPWHALRLAFDVHWKISDPQLFADAFSFADLERDAVAVPSLGASAKTPADVHALLIACVHRVAHHYDQDIVLYLHDIDLLARRLDAAAWERVVALAAAKRIRQVVSRGLRRASDLFGTPVPPAVERSLAVVSDEEPSAAFLARRLRKIDVLRSDLRALTIRERLRLLREHLVPPPAYMLRMYGQNRPAWLPALYVIRIARGAHAWFRPLR